MGAAGTLARPTKKGQSARTVPMASDVGVGVGSVRREAGAPGVGQHLGAMLQV